MGWDVRALNNTLVVQWSESWFLSLGAERKRKTTVKKSIIIIQETIVAK